MINNYNLFFNVKPTNSHILKSDLRVKNAVVLFYKIFLPFRPQLMRPSSAEFLASCSATR